MKALTEKLLKGKCTGRTPKLALLALLVWAGLILLDQAIHTWEASQRCRDQAEPRCQPVEGPTS